MLYRFSRYVSAKAIAIIFTSIILLQGCKRNNQPDEHPTFVENVKKRIDTTNVIELDKAFVYLDSSYKALQNPGPGDLYIKDSLLQSKYGFQKHDYVKSLAYLDTLMGIVKNRVTEEKYAERYVSVLYERGECFMKMKRYNESFHYITQAEKALLRLVTDKCNLIKFKAKKAYLMFAQEKYQEAVDAFKDALNAEGQACNTDYYTTQRNVNNIALCYLKLNELDSALKYQDSALAILRWYKINNPNESQNNAKFAEAVIYGDRGEVYARQGKYESAILLYQRSIEGTIDLDIVYGRATEARLIDVYLKQNDNLNAYAMLSQLKKSLDIFGNEQQLLQWHKLAVQYAMQTQNTADMLFFQQKFDSLNAAIIKKDRTFAGTNLGKEFETLELKYKNENLQKDAKLKSVYLLLFVFVFAVVIAITLFVRQNLKRTQKLNNQIEQKNVDLQLALVSLEQSHIENNRIIRVVAHDLKSPIAAINNLVFSLQRKNYSEELTEILHLIKTASSSSMGLINDVLQNKKTVGEIRKELVDMKHLLVYCVDLLQTKADEKMQRLTLHADDALLMLNKQKMWRVVSNIVNNAIKFSPEKTVIDIRLKRNEESIVLSIQANGIGIPDNLKDKIFTTIASPEAGRMGTSGEESHGLGLSISQKIVEEHSGKIWFESKDGKGSTFFIELPYLN